MECYSCKALSGEKPIFPESQVWDGKYWVVEHAYPVKMKGWFVVILKRHVEGMHQLTSKEFSELSQIQERLIRALHQELESSKEYVCCFAEKEHFNHVHVHVIAKSKFFREELKGPAVFQLLKVTEKEVVPKDELLELCQKIKAHLN